MKGSDFMKFYSGNKLLSYKDLYGQKPEIFLSTGNRSSGKTTFFNKYLINRFKKHNEKFMLVYRWGNELEGVASKFFKDISTLKFPNDTMSEKKRENGTFIELFLNDKPCGYAVAINKAEKIKKLSHYFNDVSRMLFDEFQSESGEYCPHEVAKLISIHTSVARGHGQPVRYVPLIMISNLTSLINPYYMALGIADRLTPSTNILRGDGWVLEQSKLQGVSNAQKESAFNRAFSGSDYVKYSTDNVYLNDNLSFIDNLKGQYNYILTFRFEGKEYSIKEFTESGLLYCDTKISKDCNIKISVDNDSHNINFLMLSKSEFLIVKLRDYYNKGFFRFKNLECKRALIHLIGYRY